jgi:8-oxo-dGTP diphosphatase
VYLTGEKGILCLYRIGSRVVSNRYIGSAGGHFEPAALNDPRACVLREMQEELGLTESDVGGLRLRYITHRYMAGEIRQNYYYFGRLKRTAPLKSTEGNLEWITPEQFPELPMPVSAKHMILHYLEEGQYNNLLYGGITEENGTHFVPMRQFEG